MYHSMAVFYILGVLGALFGVLLLFFSAFSPHLTQAGIVLLSLGALGWSGFGLTSDDIGYRFVFTGLGILVMCFVLPFYAVFCRLFPPFVAFLIGLALFCLTVLADQLVGGTNGISLVALPMAAVGTGAALLLRSVQTIPTP